MIDTINNAIENLNAEISACENDLHKLLISPPDPAQPGQYFTHYQAVIERTAQLVGQKAAEIGRRKQIEALRDAMIARREMDAYLGLKEQYQSKIRRLKSMTEELEATISRERSRLETVETRARKEAVEVGVSLEMISALQDAIHNP